MAQIKKLQSGGESPTPTSDKPKKRMFNGVELTDEYLNALKPKLGSWIKENSPYSSDVREWDAAVNEVIEELKTNDPVVSPTGAVTIGKFQTNPGHRGTLGTKFNLFGNIKDIKGLVGDKLVEMINNSTTTQQSQSSQTDTTYPQEKKHYDVSKTISDRYFAGNWDNAQKGIQDLKLDERLSYVREGLKDSILKYKEMHGEDSPYLNKLQELNNPALTADQLKKIGYGMGMDVSEFLEDSTTRQDTTSTDPFAALKEYGEVIDDDYLRDKGRIALKDKTTGKVRILDRNDFSKEYGPESSGEIETTYGNHYGKGMFYDPNEGWKWGTKKELAQGNLYNTVTQKYQEIFNKNKAIATPNTIDFKNTYDPVLTGLRNRETNSLNYNDISNQFSNLGQNRVIVKDAVYDDLGNIDLQNSKTFYFDKAKNTLIPVGIDLNPTGPATARSLTTKDFTGQIFDLGAFGAGMNPTVGELGTAYSTDLGVSDRVDPNLAERFTGRVVGFQNKEITPDNVVDFYKEVVKKNFTQNLTGDEAKNLANTILKIYNDPKFKVKTALSPQFLEQLKKVLEELRTKEKVETYRKDYLNENQKNSSVNTNKFVNSGPKYKQGGILKRQAGGGIQSKKIEHTPLTKMKSPAMGYGSARIGDVGTFSTADTLDLTAAGLDAVSLVGGPVGIATAGAATIAQSIADSKRYGFWSKENATGLGINLAFTLLAAVPGGGLLKAGKTASKAGKLGKLIGSSANPAIKAGKKVDQAKDLLKVAEESGFKLLKGSPQDVAKLEESLKVADKIIKNADNPTKLSKILNSKSVKAASNITRYGMIGVGASAGINSAGNIIEDVSASGDLSSAKISDLRGLVGGAAAWKGVKQNLNQSRLRKVTESTIVPKELTTTVKFKNIPDEFADLKKIEIGASTTKEGALKTVKSNISSKIDELKKQLGDSADKDLTDKIKSLEESLNKVDIDTNVFKKAAESLKKSKNKATGASSKFVKERIVGDWDTRDVKESFKGYKFDSKGKLIDGDDLKRSERKGLEYAKKMGYFEESPFDKAIKDLQNYKPDYSIKKSKVRQLALPAHNSKVKKRYTNPIINKPKLAPLNNIINSPFRLPQGYGPAFKQGGKLIRKGQDGLKDGLNYSLRQPTKRIDYTQNGVNKINSLWNSTSPLFQGNISNYISGETTTTPYTGLKLGQFRNAVKVDPVIPPGVTPTKNSVVEPTKTPSLTMTPGDAKNVKKDGFNLDASRLQELPKYLHALNTNKRVANRLQSVSPVLGQMPTEIYKPVVTNLANENIVNNQVSSAIGQSRRPFTSDANLYKAGQLQAMSNTLPYTLQAKSANTNMYNESLMASKDSAEKYSGLRTEIANANRERIGAKEGRDATISAGRLAADNASYANFMDSQNKITDRNKMYKHQQDTQLGLNRLKEGFEGQIKPLDEAFNNLNNYEKSQVYQKFLQEQKINPRLKWEDYKIGDKSGMDLWRNEQEMARDVRQKKYDELMPMYQEQITNLQYRNPFTSNINMGTSFMKKGGSINEKIEIQHMKNKIKAQEIDAKNMNKSLETRQKAVKSILNGLSKESMFLLKTMLGK